MNPPTGRVFFFRQIFGHPLFWGDIWALRNPKFPAEKTPKKHPSLPGRRGLKERVWKKSGSISKKRRGHLGFYAENVCNLHSCRVITYIQYMNDFWRDALLGMTLCRQFFEDLREKFWRRALGYLEPARSGKKRFHSKETPGHYRPFRRSVVGGDTFPPLVPILGPEQKNWVCHLLPLVMAVSMILM